MLFKLSKPILRNPMNETDWGGGGCYLGGAAGDADDDREDLQLE